MDEGAALGAAADAEIAVQVVPLHKAAGVSLDGQRQAQGACLDDHLLCGRESRRGTEARLGLDLVKPGAALHDGCCSMPQRFKSSKSSIAH